jgi:hypothetical protein
MEAEEHWDGRPGEGCVHWSVFGVQAFALLSKANGEPVMYWAVTLAKNATRLTQNCLDS